MGAVSAGPFAADQSRDPTRPWAASPFKRLARVHAASVAGDATFNVAMAGLVFLNVTDLNQARWRVAAALVFTVVPFTLAAPFIGPLIDRARGGRKWMVVGLSIARALLCLALIRTRDNTFLLYPEFLLALVCQKGYVIAKSSIVPTTVHSDEELVTANSKLSALSGIAAIAGGLPAILAMWLVGKLSEGHGPDGALVVAFFIYVAATVLAWQLPNARIADQPADAEEEHELQGASIRHASTAIMLTRFTVGFLTFMLAFFFKDADSKVGLVGSVVGAQAGFMIGAFLAPRIRRMLSEEQIITVALGVIALAGLLTAAMGEIPGATLIAFGVGLSSNTAKQAFDALVQRDAPDANRGRAFARFETRFQLVWVIGALIPTAIAVPIGLGFILIAVAAAGVLAWYYSGLRRIAAEARRRPSPLETEPELVEPRPPSRSFLRGRRPVPDDAEGVAPWEAGASGPVAGLPDDPTVVAHRGTDVDTASVAGSHGVPPGPHDPTVVAPVPGGDELVEPADAGPPADGYEPPLPPGDVAHPVPPPPPPPVLYDGAADLDSGETPRVGSVRLPDPGPPSLVPPAAPVGPRAHLVVPPAAASDRLELTPDDGAFPELPWRDAGSDDGPDRPPHGAGTPPLPGFEDLVPEPDRDPPA